MDKTRQEVSVRRQFVAFAVLGSLLLIGFTRLTLAGSSFSVERYDLLLRRPMSDYPQWMGQGWLPLDIVVAAAMVYGVMYVMTSPELHSDEPSTIGGTIVMALRMTFGFLGGAVGVVGVGLGGWYTGIQFLIVGGIFGCTLMTATLLLMGIMFGAGWLIREGYHRYLAQRLTPLLAPLRRYFTAQDVPNRNEAL